MFTKFQLFTALGAKIGSVEAKISIPCVKNMYSPKEYVVFDYILGVDKEDGSGHNFNVTGITKEGKKITVFVRTID